MGRRYLFTLFIIAGLCGETLAQRSIEAFPLQSAITIDGVHEEASWSGANSATGFVQMAPVPGEASSQRTVTYIGYDSASIYV
ncbi:MAG: hypothetical protein U9R60_16675, partial [Bacteroidota bacterium]|nr:hypothetical protein [Bacteroidota bacterium]